MIKYKANDILRKVEWVEVAGETNHFVKLPDGRREPTTADYYSYFGSHFEAQQYLIDKAQSRIDGAHIQLDSFYAELRKIKSEGMWQRIETAPVDALILLDVGYSWPVVGMLVSELREFIYASSQPEEHEGSGDMYLDPDHEKTPTHWTYMPGVPIRKS